MLNKNFNETTFLLLIFCCQFRSFRALFNAMYICEREIELSLSLVHAPVNRALFGVSGLNMSLPVIWGIIIGLESDKKLVLLGTDLKFCSRFAIRGLADCFDRCLTRFGLFLFQPPFVIFCNLSKNDDISTLFNDLYRDRT